jgi:hypothetical protein
MNTVAKWLIAVAMTGVGSAATAQDTQFNVTGQFASGGGSFSGELMINTVTGSLDSGTIGFAGFGIQYGVELSQLDSVTLTSPVLAPAEPPGVALSIVFTRCCGSSGEPGALTLSIPGTSLIGYTGGPILPYGVADSDSQLFVPVDFGAEVSSGSITAAPEIDPASAASGLTLLLGSVMVLRGQRFFPAAPTTRVRAAA